jgi:hypothetical protein
MVSRTEGINEDFMQEFDGGDDDLDVEGGGWRVENSRPSRVFYTASQTVVSPLRLLELPQVLRAS